MGIYKVSFLVRGSVEIMADTPTKAISIFRNMNLPSVKNHKYDLFSACCETPLPIYSLAVIDTHYYVLHDEEPIIDCNGEIIMFDGVEEAVSFIKEVIV